jgi:hypothetical protein
VVRRQRLQSERVPDPNRELLEVRCVRSAHDDPKIGVDLAER